jgi:hypothetical protein
VATGHEPEPGSGAQPISVPEPSQGRRSDSPAEGSYTAAKGDNPDELEHDRWRKAGKPPE